MTITDLTPSHETATWSGASCSRHWSPTNASSSTSSLSRRRPPKSTLRRSDSRRTSLKCAKRVWRAWNGDADRLRWRDGGGETVARQNESARFDLPPRRCLYDCLLSLIAWLACPTRLNRIESIHYRPGGRLDCVSKPRGNCCSPSSALSLEWLSDCELVRLSNSRIPLASSDSRVNLNSVCRSFPTQPATLSPVPPHRQTRSGSRYHQITSLYHSRARQPRPSREATSRRDGNLGLQPDRLLLDSNRCSTTHDRRGTVDKPHISRMTVATTSCLNRRSWTT